VQKAASPTTQKFGGYQPNERKGMLEDMHEVPEGEPFNIINALSAVRRLLTIDEVADLLGKSKSAVYRMAQEKHIPAMMIGGSWRFDPSTLAIWLVKKEPQLAVAARRQLRAA
jgi:excisionase family DNA binding protein